jgi:hypothetical protein
MNTMTENTSGQGASAVVPREIQGWNWGAFLLTWIWGIGNNVLIALLMLVPLVNIVMWFVLGAKGTEWAWRNKRWDSVEHFQRVQREWTKWGVIIALASFVLAAIFATILFFGISGLFKGSQPYLTALARMDANPAAMSALGEPVHGGFPRGSMNTVNGEGAATLQIPVTGSRKSGTLYVEGTSTDGQWRYQRLELVVDGQDIDLNAEAAPASGDGK